MTASMPMFAAPESGFDRFDPANVARVVAWLATDASAAISGQIFIVIGGDVHLVDGFRIAGSVHRDGPWPIDELVVSQATLFGDQPSGVPGFRGPH
jgi:hypothetical protein